MPHKEHAATQGRTCHVGHMGPDGTCLNCGWRMWPEKSPAELTREESFRAHMLKGGHSRYGIANND